VALLPIAASARENAAPSAHDAAELVELRTRLDLTDSQATEVGDILAERAAQARGRAAAGSDRRERQKRAKARAEKASAAIDRLLSAEQRARYTALVAERRERARQRLADRGKAENAATPNPESPSPKPKH
jgi:hypothetical protein